MKAFAATFWCSFRRAAAAARASSTFEDSDTTAFAGAFFAGLFFAGAFFAGALVAAAFFAGLFFAGAFFAGLFFAGAFFAGLFFAGAFFAAAFFVPDAVFFAAAFFATPTPFSSNHTTVVPALPDYVNVIGSLRREV
ncbi:MAG: hypothetical protein R8J94_20110 [Acidimicrobiia bacterium]|nr:hypothetical protein [Acidimicrobiia bacterium]